MFNCYKSFDSLQKDKILDITKLKAFADDNLNVAKMTISLVERVENTEGKGKMLVPEFFFFSHWVFQSPLP